MVPGFRGPTPPKPGQHRVRGLTPREVARIGRGRHNVGVPDLDSSFFAHPPVDVAPKLLGLTVSHAGVTLRITEVEAYHGAVDPGSHGFKRRTDRNSALFGPPGTCYVYINYGIHRALNLVCGADGESAGCLVRSGEIIDGLDLARIFVRGKPVPDVRFQPGLQRRIERVSFGQHHIGLDDFGA